MESRKLFLKGEIKRIKQLLNESYVYYPYSYDFDNEKRFKKIINLLRNKRNGNYIEKNIKRKYLKKILYQLL